MNDPGDTQEDEFLLDGTEVDWPPSHHGWPSSALTEDTDIPEAK
jgi:hypothetical protein